MSNSSDIKARNVMHVTHMTESELKEICERLDALQPLTVRKDEIAKALMATVRRGIVRGIDRDQLNTCLAPSKLFVSRHQYDGMVRDLHTESKTKRGLRKRRDVAPETSLEESSETMRAGEGSEDVVSKAATAKTVVTEDPLPLQLDTANTGISLAGQPRVLLRPVTRPRRQSVGGVRSS